MSVVEARADIKNLLLEVYYNQNWPRRQTSRWGEVNSLARRGCGPEGLVFGQKVQFLKIKKPAGPVSGVKQTLGIEMPDVRLWAPIPEVEQPDLP